jgi:L-fuculose-phosphate aldolase
VPEVIATLGQVPIVPYGTPSTEELPDRMAPWVASHDALLLANHGAVTYAATLARAIDRMESIEQAARSHLVAQLLGRVNRLSRGEVDRLMSLDPYGSRVRNPGCTLTRAESLGDPGEELLRAEVARIVRESLDGA